MGLMLLEAPTRFTTPVMIATTGFGEVRWTGILALKMNNVFFLGGVPAKWPGMPAIRRISMLLLCGLCCTTSPLGASDAPPPQINHPLSLAEVLDLAILNNPEIQKSRKDLEATEGVVLQTRAIAWPKLQVTGNYAAKEPSAVDKPGILIPGFTFGTDQSWQSQVRVVQSIYEGGRVLSGVRAAKLMRERSALTHQTVLAKAVLDVELAYDSVLLADQQIRVQEAAVMLLERELLNTRQRLEAGTVPRFNVLRAEVELANARPRLIKARNSLRTSKNNLANLIGIKVPHTSGDDIPLSLSGTLSTEPLSLDLPSALDQALTCRPELGALQKAGALLKENLKSARAGSRPSLQAFGGYGAQSSIFSPDLDREAHGWMAGVQLTWDVFDGWRTKGRVAEAAANAGRNDVEQETTARQIELEVRIAYSNFGEAREVLESQKKVIEAGEEAVRLATARNEAGTGTQLDLLGAQTALTEARTTQIQAMHDYAAARARLRRAVGANIPGTQP
jgi:outer membrane protein TolC